MTSTANAETNLAASSLLREVSEALLISCLYGIAAVVTLAPLFTDPAASVIGPGVVGSWLLAPETELLIWNLSWLSHALTSDPIGLLDANILPPLRNSLAAVFPNFGHLPIFGPILGISDNAVLAHQLNLLANISLSGGAAYWLARHWGIGRWGALFAGLIYALAPARISSIATPAAAAGQYLPVGLIFFERAVSRRSWTSATAATILFVLQTGCAITYLPIVAVTVLVRTCFLIGRIDDAKERAVLLAVVSATLMSIIVLITPASLDVSSGRLTAHHAPNKFAKGLDVGKIPSWGEFIKYTPATPVHGALNLALSPFVGLITLLLAAIGFATTSEHRSLPRPTLGLLALIASIAATTFLGKGILHLLPWRSPLPPSSHFILLFVLIVAVTAGAGLCRIIRVVANASSPLIGAVLVPIAAGIFAWETYLVGAGREITTDKISPQESLVQTRLSERPHGSYVEIPFPECDFAKRRYLARSMLNSIHSWRPVLNSFGDLKQKNGEVLLSLINALPNPRAISLLSEMVDLKHIVLDVSKVPVPQRDIWTKHPAMRDLGIADGRLILEITKTADAATAQETLLHSLAERRETLLGTEVARLPESGRKAAVSGESDVEGTASLLPTTVHLNVRNVSSLTWPVLGGAFEEQVRVAYRWEDSSGATIGDGEERRTRLPFDLEPQESVSFDICVQPPNVSGIVYLVIGITQGGDWFAGKQARVPINVRPLVPVKL